MNTTSPEQVKPFEQLVLNFDLPPWGAIYRGAIGLAVFPAVSYLWGQDRPGWQVIPFLLGILLLLRVVPAVVRKVVPFSNAVQLVWFERRQLAKRYDSYQWRKLFWIGVGLALYTAIAHQLRPANFIVSSFCLLTGAVGLARWRVVATRAVAAPEPVKHLRDLAEDRLVAK